MGNKKHIKLCAIVAMAENRVIGKDNDLIWHISEDLKHFKRTTLGKPIIMGRKSYDSLGRTLPKRPNIVISRSKSPEIETKPLEGPFFCASIDEAIALGKDKASALGVEEIFITGGGQIYAETLEKIEHLYLTIIHSSYEGDTYFPEINWNKWMINSEEKFEGDPAFTIFKLQRKTKNL